MAINVRKGTGHSLLQTDVCGALKASEGVDAGMLVYVDGGDVDATTGLGKVKKVLPLDNSTRASATNKIGKSLQIGFAITTQSEGDAIESGKIGIYVPDGGTVIETSYYSGTITIADLGKPVVQEVNGGTAGKVSVITDAAAVTSAERIIGHVYGAPRSIFVGQTPVTVLPIKLAV